MGKLETPLTWALAIFILGYFALNSCCKVDSNDEINNGFNWSDGDGLKVIVSDCDTDINIDSLLTVVVEELESDSTIKALLDADNLDTNIIESSSDKNSTEAEEEIIILE